VRAHRFSSRSRGPPRPCSQLGAARGRGAWETGTSGARPSTPTRRLVLTSSRIVLIPSYSGP
jgi:hypothetical protein